MHRKRKETPAHDILYLLQDMREFELYGTVRAVVSICDAMNYILTEEELRQVFCLVNNYLDPGGIFVFDLNTDYKYRDLLGDTTLAESREECSFIWENTWYEEEQVNEYDLTIFKKEKNGLFRRYTGNTFSENLWDRYDKETADGGGNGVFGGLRCVYRRKRRERIARDFISLPERKERKRYDRLYCSGDCGGQPDSGFCGDDQGDGGSCAGGA